MFKNFLLIFITFTGFASAGVRVSDDLLINDHQLNQIRNSLPKTTRDQDYFHWTASKDNYERWIKDGYVGKGEIDFLNSSSDGMMAGGGFYLADNSYSSSTYGRFGLRVHVEKGTFVYSDEVIQKIVGRYLTQDEKIILGSHIPFLHNYSSNGWNVAHHPEVVNKVYSFLLQNDKVWELDSETSIYKYLTTLKTTSPHLHGMGNSLLSLIKYLDVFSIIRAVQRNPRNPWREFEPEKFENFNKANQKVLEGDFKTITSRHHKDPDEWVQEQISKGLIGLNSLINGNTSAFRTEGILAGGSYNGEDFVTPMQLANLLVNPYLTVTYRSDDVNKKGFFVKYSYPDIFHYEKVKDKLSKELLQKIEASKNEDLMKNTSLRHELNQHLLHDLVGEALNRFFTTTSSNTKTIEALLKLYQDLISIHPFEDGNGRTMRLYLDALSDDHYRFYHAIPEFDLYLSLEVYRNLIINSQEAEVSIWKDLFSQIQNTKYYNERGFLLDLDYPYKALDPYQLGQGSYWPRYGDSKHQELSMEEVQYLSEKRRWNELMEKLVGKLWDANEIMKTNDKYSKNSIFTAEVSKTGKKLLSKVFEIRSDVTTTFVMDLIERNDFIISSEVIGILFNKFVETKEPYYESIINKLLQSSQASYIAYKYLFMNLTKLDKQFVEANLNTKSNEILLNSLKEATSTLMNRGVSAKEIIEAQNILYSRGLFSKKELFENVVNLTHDQVKLYLEEFERQNDLEDLAQVYFIDLELFDPKKKHDATDFRTVSNLTFASDVFSISTSDVPQKHLARSFLRVVVRSLERGLITIKSVERSITAALSTIDLTERDEILEKLKVIAPNFDSSLLDEIEEKLQRQNCMKLFEEFDPFKANL